MMKIRFTRYSFAIFLFSLLIGTLPMIVLGIFSYAKSSDIIQNKVIEENMQNLLQTQMRVEQTLKIVDNMAIQYVNSSIDQSTNISSLMYQNLTPYDFQTVNEISGGLYKLQTYELGIEDIYLINVNEGWFIDNSGLSSLSGPINRDRIEMYMDTGKTSFWTGEQGTLYSLSGSDDKSDPGNYVCLVKKLPINSPNPQGLFVAEIPYGKISTLLLKNNAQGNILILDGSYNTVVNGDDSLSGQSVSSSDFIQEIKRLGTTEGHFIAKVGGNDVWVTFCRSGYNGWSYVSFALVGDITRESKSIGWMTIFITAGILLITLFISARGSQKIYSPVRSLFESVKESTESNSSIVVKDEFKFIRDHVYNLINTRSELDKTIRGQVEQLKELFFIKLVQGRVEKEEIDKKLGIYGISTDWKRLCVLVLQIDTLEGSKFHESDIDILMFAVNNVIDELIPSGQRSKPILIDQYQVTMIFGNHEEAESFKRYVFSIAEMIQKSVLQYLKVRVNIGISRSYSSFSDVQAAYREGIEALKYRVELDREGILHIDEVLPEYHHHPFFPKEGELELIDSIKLADSGKSYELLHHCIKEVFRGKSTRNEYQMALSKLLMDIVWAVQELDDSFCLDKSEGKSLFDQLFELKTEQEIERWFKNAVVDPALLLLEKHRGVQNKDITERVINMIKNEYETDLTLVTCAYRLNYHPNHISRVFRNETGMNFRDYLNQHRINVAKKWLAETDMKVGEIAERLKYNNSQNFIRSFKKIEGVTPGQYSEMHKPDKSI